MANFPFFARFMEGLALPGGHKTQWLASLPPHPTASFKLLPSIFPATP